MRTASHSSWRAVRVRLPLAELPLAEGRAVTEAAAIATMSLRVVNDDTILQFWRS